MPQRSSRKVRSLEGVDVNADIQRMWRQKEFRPTVSLIGLQQIDEGVYRVVPLVNYADAPQGVFIPPQRIIKKNETIESAMLKLVTDGFDVSPHFPQPALSCYFAYDQSFEKDRIPKGFTKGKSYYFGIVNLDGLTLTVRSAQSDPNPITEMVFADGLGMLRSLLAGVRTEDKRWAIDDAVIDALHRRFEAEKQRIAA